MSKLKSLFIIVLLSKIAASVYAFYLGFSLIAQPLTSFSVLWHDPIWRWSFTLPLGFMLIYVFFGWLLVRKATKKERASFADSCYYLGFLFTIASIIIALTSIRDDGFSVAEIAIRFAAAMLTTFIGMAIRLFMITFGKRRITTLLFGPKGRT